MKRGGLGLAEVLAVVGAVVLLVGLFALHWYGVGEGKIAPIEIGHPTAPGLYAQIELQPRPVPGGVDDPRLVPDLPSPPDDLGAWTAQGLLGTLANIVLLAAALGAIAVVALRAMGRTPPGQAGTVLSALGLAAILVVVLRLAFRPEDVGGYEFEATLKAGGFVALVGAILVTAGGFLGARERGEPPAPPPAPSRR